MCQRVSSDPGDVHSVLSSTAQPRSSGLMPVAFMQPVPLLLVFLFSCCLLIMCPKWDSFHLSLLRPAVFQASFALGPPDLSFWWSRVSIELSSDIIFPMKPFFFFFATSFHCSFLLPIIIVIISYQSYEKNYEKGKVCEPNE